MSPAVLILLAGAIACLLLAQHPFITYPLSLWVFGGRRRQLRAAFPQGGHRPPVSICMSVYNEERVIEEKITSLLDQARHYGPASVHIYADGCSDGTVEVLRRFEDRIDLVVSPVRTGKTRGMNELLARSDGQILVFTDANVAGAPDAIVGLVAPFADPTVGCVSANLVYSNAGESATSRIGALYWQIEEAVKRIESSTIGMIGVDGAMFAIRRALYRPAPPSLIDDLYVTLNVLIQGADVLRQPAVAVTERSAIGAEEEYRRKVRISCQAMNVHRALWPSLRRTRGSIVYGYVSHRLLKWLIPFLLLGCILCGLAAMTLLLGWKPMLMLVLGCSLAITAGAWVNFPPAAFLWSAVLSLVGVAQGLLQSWFTRRTYTIWTPAASVRQGDTE